MQDSATCYSHSCGRMRSDRSQDNGGHPKTERLAISFTRICKIVHWTAIDYDMIDSRPDQVSFDEVS